jgi:S-adenosyl-L-methionine hydrolase (adenosine-forming)
MAEPLITLTTDFGQAAPYVAAMKGAILAVNPQARLIDLTHQIPPQNLRYTAFFLNAAIPCFPADALHVVVVDPGVGTERALLYIEVNGHRLLVPDNGCWTILARPGRPKVIRLSEARYWRHPISPTFHGRDILAPVAGHLSRGLDPRQLGPEAADWSRLELPSPSRDAATIRGEVLFVDCFGNLITNIASEALPSASLHLRVLVAQTEITRRGRTYQDTAPDTLVALISSSGLLEIAINQGNAARQIGASVGTPVVVVLPESGG